MADRAQNETSGRADPQVLQMLVCPRTRTALVYSAARQELISRAARLAYPIRDGIAIMAPEEAREVEDEELRKLGNP